MLPDAPAPTLAARIMAALVGGLDTSLSLLQSLLLESGGEHCFRRERISYLLTNYLTRNTPLSMAPSTTHRFKAGFADRTFEIHDPETHSVTAYNLTDEDAIYLLEHDGGHLIEPLPKAEKSEKAAPADKADELPTMPHKGQEIAYPIA